MNTDEILGRILDNQEKQGDCIQEINITLQKQHDSLEEHKRRSEANEQMIIIIKDELKPIKAHVLKVQFVGTAIVTIVAFLASVATALRYFFP